MASPTDPLILIVEDEAAQLEVLNYNIAAAGYRVTTATDGEDALLKLSEENPDLVLLDWMLPSLSGIEICRRIKSHPESREIPVIMLSARGEEADKVMGLEMGADDYVAKPYSISELIARIRANLRRVRPAGAGATLTYEDISLDPETHKVHRAGILLKLGPTEFRLLSTLMEKPGKVWSREQLLDRDDRLGLLGNHSGPDQVAGNDSGHVITKFFSVHKHTKPLGRQHVDVGVQLVEERATILGATERPVHPGDVFLVVAMKVRVVWDKRENPIKSVDAGPNHFFLTTHTSVCLAVASKAFAYSQLVPQDPGEVARLDSQRPFAFEFMARCHQVTVPVVAVSLRTCFAAIAASRTSCTRTICAPASHAHTEQTIDPSRRSFVPTSPSLWSRIA